MQKYHSIAANYYKMTNSLCKYPATKSDFNLHNVTRKIIRERQMRRLTEVWRSRDAPREVTGSHVFSKIIITVTLYY